MRFSAATALQRALFASLGFESKFGRQWYFRHHPTALAIDRRIRSALESNDRRNLNLLYSTFFAAGV